MNVEMWSMSEVKPYEANPRVNDQAVEAVVNSIREYGFRQPIVVDSEGVIVVGHTRWKAAKALGLEKVPVHVAKDLSAEKAKAYRIADNKVGELADWDYDLLPIELDELRGMDIDLELLGFAPDELEKILGGGIYGNPGLTDPDAIPEPPDDGVTQPGDLWIMGNHRLLCGDSAGVADVDRLLDGATIDLVNMDPPYNVKVEPRSNNAIAAGLTSVSRREDVQCERSTTARGAKDRKRKAKRGHHQSFDVARQGEKHATTRKMRPKDRPLENDFLSPEAFDEMLLAWFGNASRVLKPGGSFYIWGGYANLGNYPAPLKASGLYFSQGIIWDKQHPVFTRKDYMGAFEICYYGWKEGAGHHFYGPNNAPDLWHIKKVNPASMIHLTEKPVELASRAIQYSSKPGENVLDLFGGSGSTLIACEQTGRKAYLMELDELYCDVIVNRWSEFTGKKAERVSARENAPTSAEASRVGGGE